MRISVSNLGICQSSKAIYGNVIECKRRAAGAGTLEHLYQAIVDAGADAVLVASTAHFGKYTIRQMKEYLAQRQIPVNL